MKDQLLSFLAEIQRQAPEVAQQMAAFAFVQGLIIALACFAILGALAWAFFKEYDCSSDEEAARVLSFIIGIAVFFAGCYAATCAIQAKFYPKAYLAERIIGGLK